MSDDVPPPAPPPSPDPVPSVPPPPPAPEPVASSAAFGTDDVSPAYGSGKLSAADDKLYCTLAHLLSLIIWLWKKDESPAVDAHGKEAANFLITVLIGVVATSILAMIPLLGCIFMIVSPLIGVAGAVLAVIGALKANDGKLFRYPVNLRLIK